MEVDHLASIETQWTRHEAHAKWRKLSLLIPEWMTSRLACKNVGLHVRLCDEFKVTVSVFLPRRYDWSAYSRRRITQMPFIVKTICVLTSTQLLLCKQGSYRKDSASPFYSLYGAVSLSRGPQVQHRSCRNLADSNDIILEWHNELDWLQYLILSPMADIAESLVQSKRWKNELIKGSVLSDWPKLPCIVLRPVCDICLK